MNLNGHIHICALLFCKCKTINSKFYILNFSLNLLRVSNFCFTFVNRKKNGQKCPQPYRNGYEGQN